MNIVIFAALIAVASLGHAASSFNCTKAATSVEKMTCSDKNLTRLDEALAINYGDTVDAAKADKDNAKLVKIRDERRAWMTTRNRCTSMACVSEAYKSRLSEACAMPQLGIWRCISIEESLKEIQRHAALAVNVQSDHLESWLGA